MSIKEVRIHHIPASNNVDAIDVFCVWHGEKAYQITIRCWDHAWTTYRGSCGFENIEDYFIDVWFERGYEEHLVNLFLRPTKNTKREANWLRKIIKNMCIYFKELKVA